MKIVDPKMLGHLDAKIRKAGNSSRASVKASSGADKMSFTDALQLSEKAVNIRDARKTLDAMPAVRQERVAELKARLESGDYHVSSEKIADSMLRSFLTEKI